MYLVAYLVIVYGMCTDSAMNTIGDLLQQQRNLTLDMHKSLVPIIQHIHAKDW